MKIDIFAHIMPKRYFETTCAMNSLVTSGIMTDFPEIKIIPHHCGAIVPLIEGRLRQKELFRNFYGDTATYGSIIQLMCGYSFFGADHILFGTDAPLGPTFGCTLETIEAVEQMAITGAEREKIYLRNALKLLKISV